jgi:hypothetical protein
LISGSKATTALWPSMSIVFLIRQTLSENLFFFCLSVYGN